ncbi:MAG: hypothetical protein IJV02_01860 [Candidatus Methanomethylophilaceae archaeon]|nr:hypothetical protein [Candidatus Methanomethylophilaceae archaeon]MBQ7978612.1 hypothetical protein [Candidatus Methanomethylophilaceae archaeon]
MTDKILFLEGDGIGPSILGSAESVLKAATDSLEIIHGSIGREAFDKTGQYLPHETMDLLDECNIILSGPVFTGEQGEDALKSLTIQLDLFAKVKHFRTLAPDLGAEGVDISLWSSNNNIDAEISEIPDLDGIMLSKYVKNTAYNRMMQLARANNDRYGIKRISCLLKSDFFPLSSNMFKESFESTFPADEYETEILNVGEWTAKAVKSPPQEQCVLCVDLYNEIAAGILGGITGYSYLTPTCFVGEQYKLYMPSRRPEYDDITEGEFINPTSAIQSVASILRQSGLDKEAFVVRDSLIDAYMDNKRTPDLGGDLTTVQFTDMVVENIQSRLA